MARAFVRVLACALGLLACAARAAHAGDEAPRKLRHLLRYVAADYRYAVRDGQVTSRAEYDEQLLLLTDAQKLASTLREVHGLTPAVARARDLVSKKSPERDVVAAVGAVEALLVGAFRLQDRPAAPPDPERGAALFREHCATCHGATGRGDTARGRSLTPPPPDLHEPQLGDAMSPLRVIGAVEFGVDGTSMIPFTFLSEQDRWDLAFVAVGLRHAGKPRASFVPALSLPELARATDGELLDHLYAAGERDLGPTLAALRTGARRAGALADARAAWDEARLQWTWGDAGLARAALLRGIHHGLEPARGPRALAAPEATLDVDQRAIIALSAVSSGAFPTAISDLLLDTTRADRRASVTARRGHFARAIAAAWSFVVACGSVGLAAAAAHTRGVASSLQRGLLAAALLAVALWAAASSAAVSGRGRLLAVAVLLGAAALLSAAAAAARGARHATTATVVLSFAAAVTAGQCVHAGQLAGVFPAHAWGADVVVFPLANATFEACAAQAALLLAGLAAVARHLRAR